MDLNKIKNYKQLAKYTTPQQQFLKIMEELEEVQEELFGTLDFKACKGEILDVITASYNLLALLGATDDDMQLHIEKLDYYLKHKYSKKGVEKNEGI